MKLRLTTQVLSGLIQMMADCGQKQCDVDIIQNADGPNTISHTIQGGKVIPLSEQRGRVIPINKVNPIPAPAPVPDPAPAPTHLRPPAPDPIFDEPEPVDPNIDLKDAASLMGLKLDQLQGVARSLGLSDEGKKADITNRIMSAQVKQ